MRMTREQWQKVRSVIVDPPRRADGRGRPWRDSREVMDGILWVIRTNSPWKALPADYPPYQTCHRRLQAWIADGTMSRVVEVLIDDLHRRGAMDLRWMRSTRPDTVLYATRHAELRPPARRGRPDWRVHTLELLLSPRMARMLAGRCGWSGDLANTANPSAVLAAGSETANEVAASPKPAAARSNTIEPRRKRLGDRRRADTDTRGRPVRPSLAAE